MAQYTPIYDSYVNDNSGRYVPTGRMSVSNSVYLPGSDLDIQTGSLKPDRQRRCRTQNMRLEMERLEKEEQRISADMHHELSKGGVRVSMRFAIFLVAFVLFVCGIAVLVQQGTIADRQKVINRLEGKMEECIAANEQIKEQIAEASDAATICYAAARNLNMIPAESAEAIHLVAVDTRPGESVEAAPQSAEAALSAQTSATRAPTLASNGN